MLVGAAVGTETDACAVGSVAEAEADTVAEAAAEAEAGASGAAEAMRGAELDAWSCAKRHVARAHRPLMKS